MAVVAVERPWPYRAASLVRQGLTTGAVVLLLGMGAVSMMNHEAPVPAPAEPLGLSGQHFDRVLERHRCSTTGFGDDATPTEAVVRFMDGRTRVVSFDRGWASFTGDKPGELVAVCLGHRQQAKHRHHHSDWS